MADALDMQAKSEELVATIFRLCWDGDVKIVEAICKELPLQSQRVFLRNVVVVCRHPHSLLHNTAVGRRMAAFASDRRRRMTRHYMRQPLTKDDIVKFVDSCDNAEAKLAVALAAFSGLRPGQVKKLAFRNLVEFSIAGKKFSHVPSRIQIEEVVRNRRTVVRFYTFLSSRGCQWLLRDLKSRPQPTAESRVVTEQAFKGAEKVIHAADLRWHDLRDYFHVSCVMANTPRFAVRFMLGHVSDKEDRFRNLSSEFSFLRKAYAKVEKRYFS